MTNEINTLKKIRDEKQKEIEAIDSVITMMERMEQDFGFVPQPTPQVETVLLKQPVQPAQTQSRTSNGIGGYTPPQGTAGGIRMEPQ